ncbi:MAG: tetratricopeptide repeat protein [Treponema sp.]|uniref:tetratricopeptide repeat protein n=1 Tax=Treponema sp. TaxID=166 RepID=UPI003FA20CBD
MENSEQRLLYIKVPEEYALAAKIPGFDSSIPLPLLLSGEKEDFRTESLSEEMILAGMLNVFAYERDNQHIAYYRDIFKTLRPNIHDEMTSAAILKIKNADFDLAEQLLFALEGLFPEDMPTKLNIALLMDERVHFYEHAGAEDYADYYTDKAFQSYKEVLAAEPPIPEAFFNAGFFFIKQKNFPKAKSVLETYLQLVSSEDEAVIQRKQKAAELITWIETQALDDELFKGAFDFIQMGQEDKALEKIREFLEHHPKVWNAWFLLGWALRRQERWQDASEAFLHCLELGKKNKEELAVAYCDICNELAICLMELSRFDESRRWLITALEQEPENVKIISNLGTLALKEGKTEEAKAFFRTVVDIYPEDSLAREVLQRLGE